MKNHIITATYCILFSIIGIVITCHFGHLICFIICFIAWIFYFSVLYIWGKNDRPPAPLAFVPAAAKALQESLLKSRMSRLVVAVCCTAMSYMGLGITLITLYEALDASPHQDPSLYFFLLWSTAWAAYSLILFFWIKNGRAPKPLIIAGTTLGTFSVVSTFGWGLIFTFPAIILMLYVNTCSFKMPQAA